MLVDPLVISGASVATALGIGLEHVWARVARGECGVGPMPAIEPSCGREASGGVASPDGCQAADLPETHEHRPREVAYLRHVVREALAHARVSRDGGGPLGIEPGRLSIVMGTTLHGMRHAGEFLRTRDPGRLRGFLAGSVLVEAIRGLGVEGARLSTCSACSSGLGAVALACTLIESGSADAVLAGGYDPVSEYAYAGFGSLRLIAHGPHRAFSRGREGMKIGEGYAAVVVERESSARARGARVLAWIRGYGESADAHHLTQPSPTGEGAERAVRLALGPETPDLIGAHATGTPNNDAAEFAAYQRVLGERLGGVDVVAFKGHVGHTLGGAGAVELVLAILAREHAFVPPTPHTASESLEFPLRLAHVEGRRRAIRRAMVTSLGFGGANTCVVIGDRPDHAGSPSAHTVAITGCGVVLKGVATPEALAGLVSRGERIAGDGGAIDESEYLASLSARRARRLSDYVKMTLAAARRAFDDAGLRESDPATREWTAGASAILGSTHASARFSEEYYAQVAREGASAANPMLFAEGVPNSGAAHLSMAFGIKGGCQTIIGTRSAGLDALALAGERIRRGVWDRAVIGAGEEYSVLTNEGYRACGLYSGRAPEAEAREEGFATSAGAIVFVLERAELAEARGVRTLARIDASGWEGFDEPPGAPKAVRRTLERIGCPAIVYLSSCRTWIDRVERSASRGLDRREIYASIGEVFSAGPLASIAAWIGGRGRGSAGFLCTDPAGAVCALRLSAGARAIG